MMLRFFVHQCCPWGCEMGYLITGSVGYIGSHTVAELLQFGSEKVVVIDYLANSSVDALHRVEKMTRRSSVFVQGNILDRQLLDRVFAEHGVDAVVHFAGLKAVGDSVEQPLDYYDRNVSGSSTLCLAVAAEGGFLLVFSSSATVYGNPHQVTSSEDCPTNPCGAFEAYGRGAPSGSCRFESALVDR